MDLLNTLIVSGKVTYSDLNLKPDTPLSHQVSELKEDLLQVEYATDILLDVGWFPSFDPEGKFQIRIIREHDWEKPVAYAEMSELAILIKVLGSFDELCVTLATDPA